MHGRRFVAYYLDLKQYIDEFEPQLKGENIERPPIDPTQRITTEDLTELKAILLRGSMVTPIEVERVLKLLKSRGHSYTYFFRHANDGVWLEHLRSDGFFENPPDLEEAPDGRQLAPYWPPMDYLVRIFDTNPDKVIKQIERLPNTSNPHILRAIIDIIIRANTIEAIQRFSPTVLFAVDHTRIGHDRVIGLLKMPFLLDKAPADFVQSLLSKVVGFLPDPAFQKKQKKRLENPFDWTTSLEPSPRFEEWEYHEILGKGIQPLAVKAPYFIARIVIDAMTSMIRMSHHQEDLEGDNVDESLDFQMSQLHSEDLAIPDPKVDLARTLIFACKAVYEDSAESFALLDQALRNQPSKFFKRIRQLLYSLYPNEQTLPWIREAILGHEGYAKLDLDYEFQMMVRTAGEHFGADLLSKEELDQIINIILNGPPYEIYHLVTRRTGEPETETNYQQWQRFYHRKDLRPFASLLTGDNQRYYQELEREFADVPLSDEDYLVYRSKSGGFVSYVSPLLPEELGLKQDEDLLVFINEWEDEHEDSEDWLKRISVRGLADKFQNVFNDAICPSEERLKFWLENRCRIERPVYVKVIVQTFQEHLKERRFEHLDEWLEFCEWVLTHPDRGSKDGVQRHENSREFPDWESTRREVGDFVGVCLKENVDVPSTARESLAKLLESLCLQLDWRLDGDRPLLLKGSDHITEAINSTRSRALQDLFHFGFWVQRNFPADSVPEVTTILERRIASDSKLSLTLPERAILGMNFGNLLVLNPEWAARHKTTFFPRKDLPAWTEAFGNFLRFNLPSGPTFQNLEEEYEFALTHISELKAMNSSNGEVVDRLGQHLFDYFAWVYYPLNGEDSLLEIFYSRTTDDRERWASLFDHVGRSLSRSRKSLEKDLIDRVEDFFNWRFQVGEPEELRLFGFWLKADCLDPDWRLDALMKLLNLEQWKERKLFFFLDSLEGLLESHTAKILECFVRMTETLDHGDLYRKSTVKAIIVAGLNSEDDSVYKDAEHARELLLRGGEFDLSDFEE